MDQEIIAKLERRLGRLHARQRLGIEGDHEARVFGGGLNFFHIENWHSAHSVIRTALWLAGLYGRAKRNAERVVVKENIVAAPRLPAAFEGFTILHLTDLHVDMNPGAMARVVELAQSLRYDLAVLTGDYRGRTFGPFEPTLEGLARIRQALKGPVYGVLGNHNSIRMVPAMEEMGIRMLLNEAVAIERDGQRLHLAGIDDAHYFRVDNIEKAAMGLPHDEFSILLSHTPEIYRQAAHAGLRPDSGRSYSWRADLPARLDPDHARFETAAPARCRRLAMASDGRLHFGRLRLFRRRRAPQLPAGDHAPQAEARLARVSHKDRDGARPSGLLRAGRPRRQRALPMDEHRLRPAS